jgi:hypothetical protein
VFIRFFPRVPCTKVSYSHPQEVGLSFLKKFHWFEITLVAVILALNLYAAFSAPHNFSTRWFVRDDAYYYFKVAQNIAEGHGSTFDGMNLANGYHPLWMLVCIPIFALARFDLILPLRVLLMVMAVISAATGVLMFRLLRKVIAEPLAILAVLYWTFDPLIHDIVIQQGMETGIVALATVLMLYQMQKFEQDWRARPITRADILRLTLVTLFMLFSRLDAIYLVLLAGVWIIFRREPLRYLLPIDLFATFAVIVLAFIQRADIKIYLTTYSNSAILMAALTFVLQTVIFYFVGLYRPPKSQTVPALALQTFTAVSATTAIAAALMFALTWLNVAEMPRAVPLLYWAGMLPLTLGLRLAVRAISPWPADSDSAPRRWLDLQSSLSHLRKNFPQWLHDGMLYFGLTGLALGAYMLFNRVIFGTFMPVSGQIKRWWGSLPNDVYGGGAKTALDVFGIDPTYSTAWFLATDQFKTWGDFLAARLAFLAPLGDSIYLLIPAVLLLGLFGLLLLRWRRALRQVYLLGLIPLALSAELGVFIYGAMPYAAKHEWYWTSQMLTVLILTMLGLNALLEILPFKKLVRPAAWIVTALLGLNLVWTSASILYQTMPYIDPLAGQPYMDQLPILEGYTEPGSIIGMTGGGNAGYFIKDRTIVNMDGLINSYAYFQAMQAGQSGEFLQKMGLDYVFGNLYILSYTSPYRDQFEGRLQELPDVPVYGRKELLRFIPTP